MPITMLWRNILFIQLLLQSGPSCARHEIIAAFNAPTGRRDAIFQTASAIAGGAFSVLGPSPKAYADEGTKLPSELSDMLTYDVYKIKADSSAALNPTLESLTPTQFDQILTKDNTKKILKSSVLSGAGGALWLGEHHNSAADHKIQAKLIQKIYEDRQKLSTPAPMSIGLEQVQRQFQPALDDFVAGKITEEEMLKGVDWEKRWFWSYENYKPVFDVAREYKIPLIALNVNSEDLAVVERGGFPALTKAQMKTYIQDLNGFAEFTKPESYKTYVSYVIRPSYDLHQQMGLLRRTISGQMLDEDMSFRNFFSGRILWDEAMASGAFSWTEANPGGLMVGLVGADHVKFDNGVTGRYARMAAGTRDNISVILNPTLIDTRPSGSVSNVLNSASSQFPDTITLQLRYLKEGVDLTSADVRKPENTGGVLPLADYIIVSRGNLA